MTDSDHHAMLENHNDAMRARDELLARAERELACRDALIQDHLAKIMHLENRVDAEAHRAERAEAARDAARAVLKSIEWAAVGYVGYYVPCQACPSCRGKTGYANCYYSEPLGHAPDCALAAALGPAPLPATPIASGQAGEHFTVVFEGSVCDLDFNPLFAKTVFGRVVAVSADDALAALDAATDPARPAPAETEGRDG